MPYKIKFVLLSADFLLSIADIIIIIVKRYFCEMGNRLRGPNSKKHIYLGTNVCDMCMNDSTTWRSARQR